MLGAVLNVVLFGMYWVIFDGVNTKDGRWPEIQIVKLPDIMSGMVFLEKITY